MGEVKVSDEDWNGSLCDHCGNRCIDNCALCMAPQCCPTCCNEDAKLYIFYFKANKEIKDGQV